MRVISLREDYHIRTLKLFKNIDQASRFLRDTSAVRPGVILFPNLQTLSFFSLGPTNVLLPVSLRRLHIDTHDYEEAADSYAEAISQLSALESLTFIGFLSPQNALRLTRCKQLRELYLHQASINHMLYADTMRELAALPVLEKISIPAELKENELAFTSGFRCLNELGVPGDPAIVVRFLQTMSKSNLRAITFHDHWRLRPSVETAKYPQSLETLSILCGSSLRKVIFSVAYGIPEIPLVDVLQPLLKLNLLEHFEITLYHGVYVRYPITTDIIQEMASGWPSLRTLKLDTCRRPRDLENGCGLECLALLARSCPRLVCLEIQVYNSNTPSISDWPFLNHGLEVLKLRGPDRWDPVLLARLLHRIFPTLDLVSVAARKYEEEAKDVVGRIVRMFQAVREETCAVSCKCSCHTNNSCAEEL